MPRLPQGRPGQRLQIKGRPIPFSYWPSRPARNHYALQSLLFALDPWAIITQATERECPKDRLPEALACLEQARDFYVAGTERGIEAARPLALYYSYMNLTKAFCLTRGTPVTFDQAEHGLSERLGPGGKELTDAFLQAFPSPSPRTHKLQNFDELTAVLTSARLGTEARYELPFLIPQILSGHRLWARAANKRERFIALHDIQFWHDPASQELWLRLYLIADDLSRLSISHQRLLTEAQLVDTFREVSSEERIDGRNLICLEQVATQPYPNGYPADHLHYLVETIRPRLWMTVSTIPAYRRYYVYLCPQAEISSLLPQLLSIYAMTYYLGSVTRYRPHHFDAMIRGPYGPRIQDFVTGQPLQFIYLMTSEIAKQDVTRPSIL